MGKKRITELLQRLEDNHQRDIVNAAGIYTVAQVAVNHLSETHVSEEQPSTLALQPALPAIDKAELKKRYGSYSKCRKAAKSLDIQFKKTPTWEQLVQGFRYAEALRPIAESCVATYPSTDQNMIEIKFRFSC